jgi:hypothetical protein
VLRASAGGRCGCCTVPRAPARPRAVLPGRGRPFSGGRGRSRWARVRPVYRRLGEMRYRLGDPVTIALTGSATPAARRQILAVLRLPRAIEVVACSTSPPPFSRPGARRPRAFDRLRGWCATTLVGDRVRADAACRLITARCCEGTRAAPYHAGLPLDLRRASSRSARPRTVIVATAFGMRTTPDAPRAPQGPARPRATTRRRAAWARQGPAVCTLRGPRRLAHDDGGPSSDTRLRRAPPLPAWCPARPVSV